MRGSTVAVLRGEAMAAKGRTSFVSIAVLRDIQRPQTSSRSSCSNDKNMCQNCESLGQLQK
jgi:hypothetical protein